MTNWDDEANRLLELARHGHDPSEQDRSRIAAAFAARCLAEPALVAGKAASGFALKATLGKGIASTKLASFKLVGLPLWAAFGVGASAGAVTGAAAFYGSRMLTSVEARPAAERRGERAVDGTDSTEHRARRATSVTMTGRLPGSVPSLDVPSSGDVPPSSAARPSEFESVPASVLAARVQSAEPSAVAATTASPALAESAPPLPALASSASFAASEAASPANPLTLEVSTLRSAQQFLHAGDATQSLSVLDSFAREHAVTALREEWQATRAMALCTLGRGSSALAADFERRFPGSVHLDPVRSACATREKSPSPPTDPRGSRH